jgi:hypothetical protein
VPKAVVRIALPVEPEAGGQSCVVRGAVAVRGSPRHRRGARRRVLCCGHADARLRGGCGRGHDRRCGRERRLVDVLATGTPPVGAVHQTVEVIVDPVPARRVVSRRHIVDRELLRTEHRRPVAGRVLDHHAQVMLAVRHHPRVERHRGTRRQLARHRIDELVRVRVPREHVLAPSPSTDDVGVDDLVVDGLAVDLD